MIYKIIGSAVILLAGGYVSAQISRYERRRLRVLDGYISLVYYIKGQIECFARPLREILAEADPLILSDCLGPDHPSEVEPLAGSGGQMLAGLLDRSRLYLTPEARRLLTVFSSELGRTYRAEQVMRCEHYITALGEERRRMGEALQSRIRLGSVLCLCTAAGVAVLLW